MLNFLPAYKAALRVHNFTTSAKSLYNTNISFEDCDTDINYSSSMCEKQKAGISVSLNQSKSDS